jgi:hypothetical protein
MISIGFPALLRKSLPAVYTLAFLLTILTIFIGFSSPQKILKVITGQLNKQRLILKGTGPELVDSYNLIQTISLPMGEG